MKKILSVAVCAAACPVFALDVNLGEVGVTEVTNNFANTIVAVSYAELSGGTTINPQYLVKTTNLTKNDRLIAYTDGTYKTWVLDENEDGVLSWKAMYQEFSQDASGGVSQGVGPSPSEFAMSVGSGIWLVRQYPEKAFYIYGKPVQNKTSAVTTGKWNLLGNPLQVAKLVDFGEDGDFLLVSVNGEEALRRYECKGGVWSYTKIETVLGPGGASAIRTKEVPETPTIPAGIGFWYKTAAEDKVISWEPTVD